jgi:hypothetical protein
MDPTVEMPNPPLPPGSPSASNPVLSEQPAPDRPGTDEAHHGEDDDRTWIDSRMVAAAAAAVAVLALLLTAASLSIAITARSEARAAQESRDEGRAEAADALRSAAGLFDTLAQTQLAVDVEVDEVVPIEASLPLEQTYQIPLKTSVQVQQNVTTTVVVPTLFGDRPTEINIPLDLNVPIDTVVPFTFDEPIDLSTETRVQADVPIELDLADTELAPLARNVGDELIDLAVILEQNTE